MNRHAILLTSIAACCASPAIAQDPEIDYRDGEYVVAVPAEQAVKVLTESQEAETVPAERVVPVRRQPVMIRRVIVEDDLQNAGADYVRRTGTAQTYYVRRPSETSQDMRTLPIPPGARIVSFDRESWLSECRERLATYEESDRGKIIGALAGAALGGVLGNRIAGSGNRAIGTIAGAGAGAVAGAVVGDAVEGDPQPSASAYGECEAYLDDYMESARSGELRTAPAYYGQEYMLVPVTITVPQKAVWRDVEVEPEE